MIRQMSPFNDEKEERKKKLITADSIASLSQPNGISP